MTELCGRWLALAGLMAALTVRLQPQAGADRADEPFSRERLERHVRFLSEACVPRNWLQAANLNRAADYIRAGFVKSGGDVSEQTYVVDGRTFRNILVRFGPAAARRIVVGAHYDAYEDVQGADNNASGVAGLIELACFFGRRVVPPASAVELAAYATEEPPNFRPGRQGSGIHARALKAAGIEVLGMIALDQIGVLLRQPGSQRFPFPELADRVPSRAGDFLAVVADPAHGPFAESLARALASRTNLPIYPLVDTPERIPFVAIHDAARFWDQGFTGALLTDTAPYRGDHRHTAKDTWDRLDFGAMRAILRALSFAVLDPGLSGPRRRLAIAPANRLPEESYW